jgi:hypothetical protein
MSIGKTKMKRILFLLSIFIIVSCSNRQSTNPSSNMQLSRIIAQESTECLCCPGFYIEIENDTLFVPALPQNDDLIEIMIVDGFPIDVLVELDDFVGECPNYDQIVTEVQLAQD